MNPAIRYASIVVLSVLLGLLLGLLLRPVLAAVFGSDLLFTVVAVALLVIGGGLQARAYPRGVGP
ncbi:MAG: hypothetical protein AVDCRST_MAG22-2861 [uncultured Rubrobacteraceae bacterium]|uniref:Uncharacterized protein n=1 Tax=uncultured Rubrobacteraceae bacterium TaxID=349277 RepID=A0A6J4PTT6_9ACTN|nr:MAG: hypothetical protein AVDCRST_MAG22-2861 [uncultured Rubrobacteraceae bacterium]